jgi:hypothetical protein
MSAVKTVKNDADVDAFLASIEHPIRRSDAVEVREIMARVSGDRGSMWGDSIVGFGDQPLPYTGGNPWFAVGFSPRKRNLVLYVMDGFEAHRDLLDRLGPHDTGKACLYLTRLDQIDRSALEQLIERSFAANTATDGSADS